MVDGYQFSKLSFVRDGVAARYKVLRNGKRQIINILLPGDIVGLPGSFLERATFSVIALTDMKLDVCSLDAFVAACYRRPKFALALSWLAVHEATSYAEHLVDVGRRTALERMAHFLLEIHARLLLVGRATERGIRPAGVAGGDGRRAGAERAARQSHAGQAARRRADRPAPNARVEFIDIRALQLLAHFEPTRLSRIPVPVAPASTS